MLSKTPITNGQTKWIRAEMPRQAACTNDCGVWMCCVAAAYVAELLQQSLLEENEERGRQKTNLVSKVSISTIMAEKELGRMGHRHNGPCSIAFATTRTTKKKLTSLLSWGSFFLKKKHRA